MVGITDPMTENLLGSEVCLAAVGEERKVEVGSMLPSLLRRGVLGGKQSVCVKLTMVGEKGLEVYGESFLCLSLISALLAASLAFWMMTVASDGRIR